MVGDVFVFYLMHSPEYRSETKSHGTKLNSVRSESSVKVESKGLCEMP